MLITLMVAVPLMNASSGSCCKNVKWNLSRDGVLVISGKGDMKNFGGSLPYRPDFVKRALIEEGVTSIGKNTVKGCRNLAEVSI